MKLFIQLLKESLKDSTRFFWPFLRSNWLLLLATLLGCEFMHHYFTLLSKLGKDTASFNLFAIFGDMTTSLLEYVVLSMLVPLRIMEMEENRSIDSFWGFNEKHIVPLTLESLRALGVTILWLLLFVIPGIFKYIRLIFVPYIVVADPEYQQGRRDALKFSDELVKGMTGPLFVLISLLTALEFWRGSFRENNPLMQSPLLALTGGILFFMLSVYSNILLFRFYQLRVKTLVSQEGVVV